MSSVMRPLTGVTFSVLMVAVLAATATPAAAAKKQPPTPRPVLERSASGTIIQPTTTIIPDGYGHNKIIVIPRRRSYLDTGTEVSVGDRSFRDYVLPPGGDPGRHYRSHRQRRCCNPSLTLHRTSGPPVPGGKGSGSASKREHAQTQRWVGNIGAPAKIPDAAANL